ncbi:MAG: hypothetical protein M1412_01545 [Deltaproteobacteria bacterium]|nr:hypothetical protein [Deltaproteobacteria bacterium]MCL5891840.1 hypothetical protein [Deltaproteobacteria bacterium]
MIDLVEIQQIISNMPSVEKITSTPQVLAVNSSNIIQKEMENVDMEKLSTVVELSEVLEPVNDKNKNSKGEKKFSSEPEEEEKETGKKNTPHINIIA